MAVTKVKKQIQKKSIDVHQQVTNQKHIQITHAWNLCWLMGQKQQHSLAGCGSQKWNYCRHNYN